MNSASTTQQVGSFYCCFPPKMAFEFSWWKWTQCSEDSHCIYFERLCLFVAKLIVYIWKTKMILLDISMQNIQSISTFFLLKCPISVKCHGYCEWKAIASTAKQFSIEVRSGLRLSQWPLLQLYFWIFPVCSFMFPPCVIHLQCFLADCNSFSSFSVFTSK